MKRVRVLVAGSEVARRRVLAALDEAPGVEVVGEAAGRRAAVDDCERLDPDVLVLGLVLADADAGAVTEEVMARAPVPILLVAGPDDRPRPEIARAAVAAGAVALLPAPGPDTSLAEWGRGLVQQVRLVSGVPVIRRRPARSRSVASGALGATPAAPLERRPRLVIVGASTGGPAALRALLERLSSGFPVPLIAVVHTAPGFDGNLARWLDGAGGARVALARAGALPSPGPKQLLLAPSGAHLRVDAGRLAVAHGPPVRGCRPSVDELFASVAAELGRRAVGCLLTGMGRDGADGLLQLRRAGAPTLVQDPADCAVGGMPGAAIAAGAATFVGSIPALALRLEALAAGRAEES